MLELDVGWIADHAVEPANLNRQVRVEHLGKRGLPSERVDVLELLLPAVDEQGAGMLALPEVGEVRAHQTVAAADVRVQVPERLAR